VVAGFQVSISGRFWVSTEARLLRTSWLGCHQSEEDPGYDLTLELEPAVFGVARFQESSKIVGHRKPQPLRFCVVSGSSPTSPALKSTWRHSRRQHLGRHPPPGDGELNHQPESFW
jgi:hypothetical protein